MELALRSKSGAKLFPVGGGLGFIEFVTEGVAKFVRDREIEELFDGHAVSFQHFSATIGRSGEKNSGKDGGVVPQHGEDRAANGQVKAGHKRVPFIGRSEDEGPGAEFMEGKAGEVLSQN